MKTSGTIRRIDDLGSIILPKEVSAMYGLENEVKTRFIDGSIAADGTILDGTGFKVTHEATGVYIVKFDTPFYFSPPTIQTLVVDNPFFEPYGYKAEVVGTVTTRQFKFFTYEIKDHDLIMRDIPLEYFYVWGYKKPNE